MEAKVGGVRGISGEDMWRGSSSKEWDPSSWKWDSGLFIASPLNPVVNKFAIDGTYASPGGISSNNTSSCSDEVVMAEENGRGLQNNQLVAAADADEENLSLTLGGQSDPNTSKKSKVACASRAVCQVEGCGLDLSSAKDYHRRHKVCETHAKATKALVGNSLQRFCQQCSRFHILEEFDEGKRSCRRRLAGHNKRRRKAQPEPSATATSQNNDQNNNLLLTSLLRLISSLHSSKSDQPPDHELLSRLLKEGTSQEGGHSISRVSETAQEFPTRGGDAGSAKRSHSFDLNDTYIDSDECTDEDLRISNESSPPPTSGNFYSASQSPSNSGDGQSRTDRIIFKLFGKDPSDLPLVVRIQILDWLSRSPTDIEGYIRPGCVILTAYLRLPESAWEDLRCDLSYSLSKFLCLFDDPFWRRGWMYVLFQNQFALAYNGDVIFEKSLTSRKIVSVKPIATPPGDNVNFAVKGFNLGKSTRLLCAMEGEYLLEANNNETVTEENEYQILTCSLAIPFVVGRGFFEIEDEGLSGGFFPFIVAEEDVCREIRSLERIIDGGETDGKIHALEFLNELGWVFHSSTTSFQTKRFAWLAEFSMEREWVAVLKKLLDFRCEMSNLPLVLSELCLLHRAVHLNSDRVVKFLVNYSPKGKPVEPLFRSDARNSSGLTPLHIAAGKEGSARVVDALTSDAKGVGLKAWENAMDPAGLTPEYYARLRGQWAYSDLVRRKVAAKVEYVAVDIEKGGGKECKGCRRRTRVIGGRVSVVYRPAMVAMIAIAAVCVCVALYFKSCPKVEFVVHPFRWELLQYGAI